MSNKIAELENELWEIVKGKRCVEGSLSVELWCEWIRRDKDSWIQFFNYIQSMKISIGVKEIKKVINSSVYSDDYRRFSEDWISKSDKESYLDFCKKRISMISTIDQAKDDRNS